MAKEKTSFKCNQCGYTALKWMGQCPTCQSWESFETITVLKTKRPLAQPKLVPLSDIEQEQTDRFSSGIGELDRVLGGGFVPGSLLLVGGEPGIGKSTLLLQVACEVQKSGKPVLYLTGEESLAQIRLRGSRLELEDLSFNMLAETRFEALQQALEEHLFPFLIVDSIQTMHHSETGSSPGSVTQVREVTSRLMNLCKPLGITTILVGHITKDGQIAGPKVLEHMVDGVFYFEGDKFHNMRMLRAQKNRFGPSQELGMFQMTQTGLKEVKNPSSLLLEQRPPEAAGSVIFPCIEGTRPLTVEIQVLTSQTPFATPRRLAMGIDPNRLALILAVLEKKAGLQLHGLDVFVNIIGGFSLQEPALDLALAMAICSSFLNRPLDPSLAVFGELGLAGEVRSVSRAETRFKECFNLGFKYVICPKSNSKQSIKGLDLIGVSTIAEVLDVIQPA